MQTSSHSKLVRSFANYLLLAHFSSVAALSVLYWFSPRPATVVKEHVTCRDAPPLTTPAVATASRCSFGGTDKILRFAVESNCYVLWVFLLKHNRLSALKAQSVWSFWFFQIRRTFRLTFFHLFYWHLEISIATRNIYSYLYFSDDLF